ncbi:hypothetical protein [Kutzneria sp. CA-103260]|uniref:hypothetical protein n=1 Tax=Kutzneria sp. CA-103260 TaxID=2802641 RepID=UPI001BA852D7|nr:hypothetical protein [Kutzneria sp. CA-103260]
MQVWLPEVGGMVDVDDDEHRRLMTFLGVQSRPEVIRARARVTPWVSVALPRISSRTKWASRFVATNDLGAVGGVLAGDVGVGRQAFRRKYRDIARAVTDLPLTFDGCAV